MQEPNTVLSGSAIVLGEGLPPVLPACGGVMPEAEVISGIVKVKVQVPKTLFQLPHFLSMVST